MKPREMYSGAAPAAMGQMGQGLAEVGGNIAKSILSGYQSLGEGLGKGIQAAGSSIAGAYTDYKSAKTSNDITRAMLDDPQYREMLGIQGDEDAKAVKDNLKQMIDRHGQIGGAQFSKQFLGPIQEYYKMGREYGLKKDVALALSAPDIAIKKAQAKKLQAEADLFNRRGTAPAPAPTFGGNSLFDQPMGGDGTGVNPTPSNPTAEPAGESGIIDGELPLAPEPRRKSTSMVVPDNYLDTFAPTQKKTRLNSLNFLS